MIPLMARKLGPEYNCAHFAADLWLAETGRDISGVLGCFLTTVAQRRAPLALKDGFIRLSGPASPCIVLFRRVKATPHVGVFVRGRVVHLGSEGPVRQLLTLASVGYTSTRFYAPRPADH